MIYHKAGERDQSTDKGKIYLASEKILQAALPKRYNYINYSTFIVHIYNYYQRVRQFKEVKELVLQFKGNQRSVSIMRRLLCFFVVSLYCLLLFIL